MRVKSLSVVLVLTVVLSTSAFDREEKRTERRLPDLNPIEWVVRAVKKIVKAFDQPSIPIPGTPTTTTT